VPPAVTNSEVVGRAGSSRTAVAPSGALITDQDEVSCPLGRPSSLTEPTIGTAPGAAGAPAST
jgi:hypothetical protein